MLPRMGMQEPLIIVSTRQPSVRAARRSGSKSIIACESPSPGVWGECATFGATLERIGVRQLDT